MLGRTELGGLGDQLGVEPGIGQPLRHRRRRVVNAIIAIGEEVDIFGGPLHNAVSDEGVAAAQGETVILGGRQRDSGYLCLEWINWG